MTKTLDNIGTAMAPTWRARQRKPFTCYAVRMELVAQAAQLPEWQQQAYLDERLTELDRALDCDQAEALERWLDCEELLQGRPASIGDGGGDGSGRSVLSDDAMDALASHAEIKRRLSGGTIHTLGLLARMMEAPRWDFGTFFVGEMRQAAWELTKIARVHAQQIAHLLTKYPKSSP
jgi:hypothetical protein